VNYRPNPGNTAATRPAPGNVANRPGTGGGGTPAQRPSTAINDNNWKGRNTYAGAKTNQGNAGTMQGRNPSGDRGFAQNGGARPTTGNYQGNRPNTGNATYNRPSGGNAAATRPATPNQPAARPAAGNQPATRPSSNNPPASRPATQQNRPEPNRGGAFNGTNNARGEKSASNRGRASMGAAEHGGGVHKK
jgi:hypothetical protein